VIIIVDIQNSYYSNPKRLQYLTLNVEMNFQWYLELSIRLRRLEHLKFYLSLPFNNLNILNAIQQITLYKYCPVKVKGC